jgi:hypothetical protein
MTTLAVCTLSVFSFTPSTLREHRQLTLTSFIWLVLEVGTNP